MPPIPPLSPDSRQRLYILVQGSDAESSSEDEPFTPSSSGSSPKCKEPYTPYSDYSTYNNTPMTQEWGNSPASPDTAPDPSAAAPSVALFSPEEESEVSSLLPLDAAKKV